MLVAGDDLGRLAACSPISAIDRCGRHSLSVCTPCVAGSACTPAEVHHSRHHTVRAGRQDTLAAAQVVHPERFGTGRILPKILDQHKRHGVNLQVIADAAGWVHRPLNRAPAAGRRVDLGADMVQLGQPPGRRARSERLDAVTEDGAAADQGHRGDAAGPQVLPHLQRDAGGWHDTASGVCRGPTTAATAVPPTGTRRQLARSWVLRGRSDVSDPGRIPPLESGFWLRVTFDRAATMCNNHSDLPLLGGTFLD